MRHRMLVLCALAVTGAFGVPLRDAYGLAPDARAMPATPSIRGAQQLLAANRSSAAYSPPAGLCLTKTGRPCKPYSPGSGAIIDAMSQCHARGRDFTEPAPRYSALAASARCSDGSAGTPAGMCICSHGYCADEKMVCSKGLYEMLPGSFKLTTKLFGTTEQLYMSGDGEVKVGAPPTPEAAKWRISRMKSGVKLLFTDAYRNHVLMEYESCSEHVNEAGFVARQCGNVAGHVRDPEAQEAGWRLEIHSALPSQRGFEEEHYLQLRSEYSGNLLFISPTLKDAQTCEDTGSACPGDYGAIRFHPPLPQKFYDGPPRPTGSITVLVCTWGVAVLLVCCVYTLYSAFDTKATRYDDSLLWICIVPLKEFGKALGFQGLTNKLHH